MEPSFDSGRGVSLMCYEKLDHDNTVQAYVDLNLLRNESVMRNLFCYEDWYRPNVDYFAEVQTDIKPYMRRIVANWMLEVCEEQECPEEVFPLAMNFLDRFLCTTPIKKTQFQLLGTTCLFLASKLRMTRPLNATDLVIYTDKSITLEELKNWEILVLARLKWDLNAVIGHDFVDYIIDRLSSMIPSVVRPAQVREHSQCFISLCATDHNFSLLPSSMIAAASIGAAVNGLYHRAETQRRSSNSHKSHSQASHRRRRTSSSRSRNSHCCDEERMDLDCGGYDDEEEDEEVTDEEDMFSPTSLDDSGTACSSVTSSSAGSSVTSASSAALAPHGDLLEGLLVRLQQITTIDAEVLRSCVEQIEQLVQLRLAAENAQKGGQMAPVPAQAPNCKAEAAASPQTTPTDVHDVEF